jgi:hypothetical protein
MENPILEKLGVKGYPTVLLFDRDSKLIFRGSVETVKDYIEKILNY